MSRAMLTEITEFLTGSGLRAMEAYPGQERLEITGPVAAVSLGRVDLESQRMEFSVRVLSPRRLGAWECQDRAFEAMKRLRVMGLNCKMEPLGYESGCDCFQVEIIAQAVGLLEQAWIRVAVDGESVGFVTEFSAEQDRKRQFITAIGEGNPVGITSGNGGWAIRMVQIFPVALMIPEEPAEPFDLTVTENGEAMVYRGCAWNRLKQTRTGASVRLEWEGLALRRERG